MSEFAAQFNKDREENKKSDWFKFENGETKLRILQEPVKIFEKFDNKINKYILCWHDCGFTGSMKYLTRLWIFKKDASGNEVGELVITKLPYSVMEQVVNYMTDDDYSFSTFPMPYNIKVKKEGEKLDTKYTVIPSPKHSDVPAEALAALEGQKPLQEVHEALQEKSKKDFESYVSGKPKADDELDTIEYPADDINPNDIPF